MRRARIARLAQRAAADIPQQAARFTPQPRLPMRWTISLKPGGNFKIREVKFTLRF
jgi:hypothetical protein